MSGIKEILKKRGAIINKAIENYMLIEGVHTDDLYSGEIITNLFDYRQTFKHNGKDIIEIWQEYSCDSVTIKTKSIYLNSEITNVS